ncbi:MAG: DMT family transporter [Candidatus Atribacteria bacterium]|nr:MAG: DMT family transporter [Candidatus Atribacteria bacterium]
MVTFLWSTSWVLIKQGLDEIPSLPFAGLRYGLAFVVLLPGLWRHRQDVRRLSLKNWAWLALLGVIFYALTQGGQFLTLQHLDAIPFSLILSFSPILVAVASLFALKERPGWVQWGGIVLVLAGALIYFLPASSITGSALGFALAGITLLANSASSLLGRSINRRKVAHPLVVTAISMGIGALILLGSGLVTQGVPVLTLKGWAIAAWLAVVNTALAFTLWNYSLRSLSATESSVINNTMLIQIAILAWLFLRESLGTLQIVGLAFVACGTMLAQIRRARIARRSGRSEGTV